MMVQIANVFIYQEPRCAAIDFEALAGYVRRMLPSASVQLRGPLLEDAIDQRGSREEVLARALAQAKVRDLEAAVPGGRQVLPGEVRYELARLRNRDSRVFGILYDAGFLLDVYRELLPAAESGLDSASIIFTNQLIGSRDEADKRYHARSVILGAPAVVSTSGIVEAPARTAGYYLARGVSQALGLTEIGAAELGRTIADDFLKTDDPRLTEVAKGLTLQALSYRITGEAFCESPDCRLYNAHRQSELIRSQLDKGQLCSRHAAAIANC